MKDEINLLPPSLQHLRVRRLYLQHTGQILRRFDIAVILVAFLFAGAYLLLLSQRDTLQHQSPEPHTSSTVATDIQTTNELLQTITSKITVSRPWTPVVYDVLKTMPASVALSAVKVDDKTGNLVLSGTFSSREDIIVFQRTLAELPWVANIDAPLKNFATGSEASFSFTLTRKPPL